jgi:hypothetical protein
MALRNAKDNSFKLIFGNHELFVQFLRDFIHIDLLKDLRPEDIEDVRERYVPLFHDSKESDTVKRINLKGSPLFVIAIVEQESEVNFRTSFKMLQYICLVLNAYEKEQEKLERGCTTRKNFKYPPVLPVVFYDGPHTWTAETNFLHRTALGEVFEKYIPKFEYELVDLHRYNPEEIARFNDMLSLIMMIDRIRLKEGESLLKKLPEGYFDKLKLKIPENLGKLLSDVVTVLLERAKVPSEEISEIREQIERKEVKPMFDVFVNDFRQARREARRIGRTEGLKEGRTEGLKEGITQGKTEVMFEIARKMKEIGDSSQKIHAITGLPPETIENL